MFHVGLKKWFLYHSCILKPQLDTVLHDSKQFFKIVLHYCLWCSVSVDFLILSDVLLSVVDCEPVNTLRTGLSPL